LCRWFGGADFHAARGMRFIDIRATRNMHGWSD
jgi:hypothetical protein